MKTPIKKGMSGKKVKPAISTRSTSAGTGAPGKIIVAKKAKKK